MLPGPPATDLRHDHVRYDPVPVTQTRDGPGASAIRGSWPPRPVPLAWPRRPVPGRRTARAVRRGRANMSRKLSRNTPTWNHRVRTSEATKSCRTALAPAPARTRCAAGVMTCARRGPARRRGDRRVGGDQPVVQADAELGLDPPGVAGRDPGGHHARAQRRGDGGGGRAGLAAEHPEEDHADQRDADRVAELQAGVEHPGRRARVLRAAPGPARCRPAARSPRPGRGPPPTRPGTSSQVVTAGP